MNNTQPAEHDQSENLEHGSDDLWMWSQCGGRAEWRQLQTSVGQALGGGGKCLEVRRTGHCVFMHANKLYMYGGYYKDGSETSMYCNDFVVLNLQNVLSQLSTLSLDDCAPISSAVDCEYDLGASSQLLSLRRVLAAVGATSSIRHMVDDGLDDDDIAALSRTQPHKIATKYKMTEEQARVLVETCRLELVDEEERRRRQQQQQQQQQQQDTASFVRNQSDELGKDPTGANCREGQSDPSLQENDQNHQASRHGSANMKGVMNILQSRKSNNRNPFGNRMQMNSMLTLGQFHSGAFHIALKSLFTHEEDIDIVKDSQDDGDQVVDESEFFFRIRVLTMKMIGAGTDADVCVTFVDGRGRETNEIVLDLSKSELVLQNEKILAAGGLPDQVTIDLFERGSYDSFMIRPLILEKFRPSSIVAIKGEYCILQFVHHLWHLPYDILQSV
jgi:hypothetical protein